MTTTRVKQRTLTRDSRTTHSPPSVPLFLSEPTSSILSPALWRQACISKSPGCFGGGEEPGIIRPLSLSLLLPVLSQLKVKGSKSATGFKDVVFLCTGWRASRTQGYEAGPQGFFAFFYVLRLCCKHRLYKRLDLFSQVWRVKPTGGSALKLYSL